MTVLVLFNSLLKLSKVQRPTTPLRAALKYNIHLAQD